MDEWLFNLLAIIIIIIIIIFFFLWIEAFHIPFSINLKSYSIEYIYIYICVCVCVCVYNFYLLCLTDKFIIFLRLNISTIFFNKKGIYQQFHSFHMIKRLILKDTRNNLMQKIHWKWTWHFGDRFRNQRYISIQLLTSLKETTHEHS